MSDRFSIDEYFAEARNREDKPLVPPEQVTAILDHTSRRTVQRPVRSTAVKFIPAFGALALILIAVLMFPGDPTEPTAQAERSVGMPEAHKGLAAHAPASPQDAPPAYGNTAPSNSHEDPVQQQGAATDKTVGRTQAFADAVSPEPESNHFALTEPASIGQNPITLTNEQLARL